MEIIEQEKIKVNTNLIAPFILNLFEERLPQRPYCTDDLNELIIRAKKDAIKRRYIQQNDIMNLSWFVYDVDRPTAHFDWYELNAPAPNITAMNTENGHAHLFYGLEIPVHKQPEAHAAPLRYAAAIDVALTNKLKADPAYGGLICKNPLNNFWNVQLWESVPYELSWLADYLDLQPYEDRRKYIPPVGLGRNCTLFDLTRHWAYRQIRKQENFFNEEFFIYEIIQYAQMKNSEFPVPLPYSEVKATGKSIARWTWRNMSPRGFKLWGDNRRKKSIIVRASKADERAEKIRAFKKEHPQATNKDIAVNFSVSLRTVEGLRLSGK